MERADDSADAGVDFFGRRSESNQPLAGDVKAMAASFTVHRSSRPHQFSNRKSTRPPTDER